MKKYILPIIATLAIITVLGIAGTHDRAEQVIYTMPFELYQLIKQEIGDSPSDVQIADHYLAHQAHYDTITARNGW